MEIKRLELAPTQGRLIARELVGGEENEK